MTQTLVTDRAYSVHTRNKRVLGPEAALCNDLQAEHWHLVFIHTVLNVGDLILIFRPANHEINARLARTIPKDVAMLACVYNMECCERVLLRLFHRREVVAGRQTLGAPQATRR